MPTPLPSHEPIGTLAEKELFERGLRGAYTLYKTDTTQKSGDLDWLVFEDKSCLPVFQEKIGHLAHRWDDAYSHKWYNLKYCKPTWFDAVNLHLNKPTQTGLDHHIKDIKTPLLNLLSGTGKRIRVEFVSPIPTRGGALVGGEIKLSGVEESLTQVITQAISQVWTPKNASCAFKVDQNSKLPYLKPITFGALEFSCESIKTHHQILSAIREFHDEFA